ncbi:hypothetical protein BG006_006253 [Podila minutissima]|uniref:Uncharacterized protein n=1 Tax=Podila minutissima TaxID=64525 RepID=A0A9P5VL71_9FUNG|nr:hypothetical protein BG006_006253 [Podila minutissima]
MHLSNIFLLFILASSFTLAKPTSTNRSIITRAPAFSSTAHHVIENILPHAVETHEVIHIPDSENMLFISQKSNSVLLKVRVDPHGLVHDLAAFNIGHSTDGLHGLVASTYYPGLVWVTLQSGNKLLLLDPAKDSIHTPPKIIKEINVPQPGQGPHRILEYGQELWSTLMDNSYILRINHVKPSDYSLYRTLPEPIFGVIHPLNNKYYTSERLVSAFMAIDPVTGATHQIPVPAEQGLQPLGIMEGPGGLWLQSPLGKDAALLYIVFDLEHTTNRVLWLLSSSIINDRALNMMIRVTMDEQWEHIVAEEVTVFPTQLSKAHRILQTRTNMFVTLLASSKLLSYYPHGSSIAQ